MEKNKTKTKKYFSIYHWGGISFDVSYTRKKSDERFINSGDRSGGCFSIRVEGNEGLVKRVERELGEVQVLFDSNSESRFKELKRVINDVYLEVCGCRCYRE